MKKIQEKYGFSEREIKDELRRRMIVLKWMEDRNLINYRDVATLLSMYYSYPEMVISAILGE